MAILSREQTTAREYDQMAFERDILEKKQAHALEMKRLELEVLKAEAKISSLLKIPILLITLPVRILFATLSVIPISIWAATKQEIPDKFLNLLTYR